MPEHFTLDRVAEGVFACVAGPSGAAVGNAAIVDCGGKVVVVDTFNTATAAGELRAVVEETTGRSAFLVVNSHWHSDHHWGNQVFGDTPIVGTPRMVELMVGNAPDDLDAYAAEIDGYIETFRARLESDDEAERALAQRRIDTLGHLRECIPDFELMLPDLQIEDRLVVEGERRVEVISAGRGHTESDLFVWVPDAKAVVAADLAWNRLHPRTQDGFPSEWAESLEVIGALAPNHIVPGHGRAGDRGLLEEMASYMRALPEAVAAVGKGADPATVAPPPGTEGWEGIERFRDGLRQLASRPR